MNRNVSNAQPDVSTNPQILRRIQKYAADHPEATKYLIVDAIAASELLLAMAAGITLAVRSKSGGFPKQSMRSTANQMRKAVVDGEPIKHLKSLGPLEMFGLELVVLTEEPNEQ